MEQKILIVDDEDAIREAIAYALDEDGYGFIFAKDGAEALDLVRESAPNLVILDLRMPIVGGSEFLARVRTSAFEPFPVIVLSAHHDDETIQECFAAGASAFIGKPFRLIQLRDAVRTALASGQNTGAAGQ